MYFLFCPFSFIFYKKVLVFVFCKWKEFVNTQFNLLAAKYLSINLSIVQWRYRTWREITLWRNYWLQRVRDLVFQDKSYRHLILPLILWLYHDSLSVGKSKYYKLLLKIIHHDIIKKMQKYGKSMRDIDISKIG